MVKISKEAYSSIVAAAFIKNNEHVHEWHPEDLHYELVRTSEIVSIVLLELDKTKLLEKQNKNKKKRKMFRK